MADPRDAHVNAPGHRAADVDALILAAGRGERLGLGPKAFLTLGGRTLLERAVAVMRSVARRIIVGVPEDCLERVARDGADGVLFLPGGLTRIETQRRLLRASTAPLIVLHDIAHPFVTQDTAGRVVEAARRTGAAMAGVRASGHVYGGEGRLTERLVTRGALWLSHKPIAAARTAFIRAMERDDPASAVAGSAELLLGAGQPVEMVPVPPWSIKITTLWDWTLAQALDPLVAGGDLVGPGAPGDTYSPDAPSDHGEGTP
jgi:2-C-methyl-D-erythritol 4-phosphate cytidylyltransferase